MAAKAKLEAQNPLILRCHRLMDAFAKSDDERDFYLDRLEGFIIYVDLNKSQEELESLEKQLLNDSDRFCLIPKLTFYETKKIMEGFVNEKVYDIDTKEKLLDIIQSKDARANFIEFIQDHHSELEKWQQYYQERGRIRIIEWLRRNHFSFVFEEDLELSRGIIEKLKEQLFQAKASKDVITSRKLLLNKAKTYYSTEALNPRPKRGRPPKQAAKQEIEPQVSTDIFTTVPTAARPFLFTPDISSASTMIFSTDFEPREQIVGRRATALPEAPELENLNQKLAALRTLSSRWIGPATKIEESPVSKTKANESLTFSDSKKPKQKAPARIISTKEKKPAKKLKKKVAPLKKLAAPTKKRPKRIIPRHKEAGQKQKKMRILPKAKSTSKRVVNKKKR